MISKDILKQVVKKQKKEINLKQDTIRRDILDEILQWMNDNRVIILTGEAVSQLY